MVMLMFYISYDVSSFNNQLLKLKKGSMSVDEYTNAFTNKMEFALSIFLDEVAKIDRYAKELCHTPKPKRRKCSGVEDVMYSITTIAS